MSTSFAPPGESAHDLWFERANFAGLLLGAITYGIHLCIFATTMYFVKHSSLSGSKLLLFVGFPVIIFSLGTMSLAANIKFSEMVWIDDRNFPGGPIAFYQEEFTSPVNTLSNATFIIATLFADWLFLYRLWIIWNRNVYVTIFPLMVLLASSGLSLFTVVQTAGVATSSVITSPIPFTALSVAANVVLTVMIAAKLLSMRQQALQILRQKADLYLSTTAMIVESSALYTVTALTFLVCFATNSNLQYLVYTVYTQVVCISPLLIIMRVARGQAWQGDTTLHDTTRSVPEMVFKTPSRGPTGQNTNMTRSTDGSGTTFEVGLDTIQGGFKTSVVESV